MRKKSISIEEVGHTEVDSVEVTDLQSNLDKTETVDLLSDEENGLQQDDLSLVEAATFSLIEEKIEAARAMVADLNLFVYNNSKQIAEKGIRLGRVLIELKSLVRKSDEAWEEWADEHLPFIGKRNRQKYMRLAKRQDCHPYTDLGVDRLDMLCSATKGDDGEDPIGTLLKKYGIVVDETSEMDLDEFKGLVDVIVNKEKLEKHHIPVGLELVNAITRNGRTLDDKILKRLSKVTQDGGNPEAFLKGLLTQEQKDENEPSGEEKLKNSFNSLANKMIETVDHILKHPEQVSKIDWDYFQRLLQKLMELEAAVKINDEQVKAA
jgi:hypothetical protein